MEVFDECVVCLENNLGEEIVVGKIKSYNGNRCSCCGTLVCKSCFEEMDKIAKDAGKNYSCPICRSIPPNDYKELFSLYSAKAKEGKSWAQEAVGNAYYYGQGIALNYKKALEFYSLAGEQGNSNALNCIGSMYARGLGVKQNHELAFKFYSQAADKDLTIAIFNLGRSFEFGYGVEIDYDKSFKYYTTAAEKGFKSAQVNLAASYVKSHGTKQDFVQAYYWLRQSLKNNADKEQISNAKKLIEKIQEALSKYCHSCGNKSAKLTLQCGNCMSAFYCNRDCQAKHWKQGCHKKECRKI